MILGPNCGSAGRGAVFMRGPEPHAELVRLIHVFGPSGSVKPDTGETGQHQSTACAVSLLRTTFCPTRPDKA